MEIHTPNIQSTQNFNGLIFLSVISLLIRMQMQKKLKDNDLITKYSVDSMILELKKIHMFKMSNGEFILSEISNKQMELLKIFNAVPKD